MHLTHNKGSDNIADIGYEELAAHLLGVDIDDETVYDNLEDMFYDKYEIDLDQFETIARELMNCIQFGTSLFDDKKIIVGFGTWEEGLATMFVKKDKHA